MRKTAVKRRRKARANNTGVKFKRRSVCSSSCTKNGSRRKQLWLIMAGVLLLAAILGAILCSDLIFRRFFPLKYGVEVSEAARKYELDRWLVYAVIKVESDFVPDVESRAGAVGLMQIMPKTGEWIAWRKGESYDEARLTEPKYNVDMGCYLLSYLLDYYNGELDYAIAAYNAGSGRVDGWLADSEYFDGVTLEIPYPETSNYVAKVRYAYEKYKNLYD